MISMPAWRGYELLSLDDFETYLRRAQMKIIRTFNGLSEAEADLQIIRGCLLINFVYGNACGIEIKEQDSTREMFLSLLGELSLREENIRGNITRKDPGIRRIPTAMLKSTGKPAMPVEIKPDKNISNDNG